MTELFDTPDTMRSWSRAAQRNDATIGLVPTMGALHEGHLSLIDLAARRADRIVASIFVNPLQFDRPEDFDSYPRPIDEDIEQCRRRGVDAVYAPTRSTLYAAGFQTTVVPGPLAETMEGAMRPGHFQGVTTVVAKLFGAVQPDVAVFGEKDFQQLVVIRQMVHDLDLGIDIVPGPIVREDDGLALSSRNRRLAPAARTAARCVPAALEAASAAAAGGETSPRAVENVASRIVTAEAAAKLEYVTVFDPDTLLPLDDAMPVSQTARIAAAVWFGDVRLIDNRQLL